MRFRAVAVHSETVLYMDFSAVLCCISVTKKTIMVKHIKRCFQLGKSKVFCVGLQHEEPLLILVIRKDNWKTDFQLRGDSEAKVPAALSFRSQGRSKIRAANKNEAKCKHYNRPEMECMNRPFPKPCDYGWELYHLTLHVCTPDVYV